MNPMNRAGLLRAAAGLALVAAGALVILMADQASRPLGLANGCAMPTRVLGARAGRAAVIFHGLAANERLMEPLGRSLAAAGWRVILFDLPGHGSNPRPFSFAREEDCAQSALGWLVQSGEIVPSKTVVIGHSLGGSLAVRLAEHFPAAATIAISPAPIPALERPPANLLIFSASFDLPSLKAEAARLDRLAGGRRTAPEDFAAGRAVALERVWPANHTSLIFDPRVWRAIRGWADRAVPTERATHGEYFPAGLVGTLLGLGGLLLLFPIGARLLAALFGGRSVEAPAEGLPGGLTLVRWMVAALATALALSFVHPHPVRMFAGDYFASFVLVAGLVLAALEIREARRAWRAPPAAIGLAAALGFATVFAVGGWLDWRLTEAWLGSARWWRFGVLAVLSLPYFWAEEVALGAPSQAGRIRRFALFLLLRLVVWLALVFAYLVLASGNVLLVLLVTYFFVFSILQRLAADALRRERDSPPAAALFDAILAAWFFTMIFPLH
jgi:pimeloyl-ACP methyl ester carboxylesterase